MAGNQGGTGGHSTANVTHQLKGMNFPADKRQMIQHVKQNGGDRDVEETIQKMPDRQYQSMADVMQGFGNEPPRARHGKTDNR